MKIQNIKISELNPAAYNPRKLKQKQQEDISNSLKKFGFVDPVVVNKRNMTIVGGHQRVKVWELLGNKEVPVYFVDLDLKDEKELNIRLNANSGEWDFEKLNLEFGLDDLEDWGFDTGIDISDDVEAGKRYNEFNQYQHEDIDFDNIKSNEDREVADKTVVVVCPNCSHNFNI